MILVVLVALIGLTIAVWYLRRGSNSQRPVSMVEIDGVSPGVDPVPKRLHADDRALA